MIGGYFVNNHIQEKNRIEKEQIEENERAAEEENERCWQMLDQLREENGLTEDECIYALLIFVGCNNATASIITKTSEVTLRKRRSRFKQKTSEQVFNLFMGVK